MKGALVVFVKTPGLSPIKTRLAKGIGRENANIFFVKSVRAVESIAHKIYKNNEADCQPHWAIAENNGLTHELWKKFPQLFTGKRRPFKGILVSCVLHLISVCYVLFFTDKHQSIAVWSTRHR